MGSLESPDGARVVILGAPFDGTASYMPGSRFGPNQIRRVSDVLEEYSPQLDRDLSEVPFYDAGDIDFSFGATRPVLAGIGAAVDEVLAGGSIPMVLGGEHLVTLPAVEAVHAKHSDLAVVHFDAHADLRQDYLGEPFSHATVMRRLCGIVGPGNVFQFGIRSGTREEFTYGKENTRFFPYQIEMPLRSVLHELQGRPVYLTIDIDVVDPAFAPGTGTPEPGGCRPQELFNAIYALSGVNLVGMDIVEVCPVAESGIATSVLAAKLVREAILAFGAKKRA